MIALSPSWWRAPAPTRCFAPMWAQSPRTKPRPWKRRRSAAPSRASSAARKSNTRAVCLTSTHAPNRPYTRSLDPVPMETLLSSPASTRNPFSSRTAWILVLALSPLAYLASFYLAQKLPSRNTTITINRERALDAAVRFAQSRQIDVRNWFPTIGSQKDDEFSMVLAHPHSQALELGVGENHRKLVVFLRSDGREPVADVDLPALRESYRRIQGAFAIDRDGGVTTGKFLGQVEARKVGERR